MPPYFGNGVRCNDKQTLRATQKMNANIIAHFVIVWHTDEKPTSDHTKHQIQFSVQKDEDRDRNTKTERKIRRQREKYEDGERNTKTGRKIQIQRKKI